MAPRQPARVHGEPILYSGAGLGPVWRGGSELPFLFWVQRLQL